MSFEQHNPPHPGEFIEQVYILPMQGEISRSDIAKRLGVSRATFNRLVNTESNVSPKMALRLEKVLGGSAQSWLKMQMNYDLYHLKKKTNLGRLKPMDFSAIKIE